MAKFVLKDAIVTVNAVALSNRARTVTVTYSAAEQDDTAMGATAQSRLAGLTDFQIEVEWLQDYAASNVDVTLFQLVGAAPFAIKVRPTSGAISATNPEYQGNVILTSYQPLGQQVGNVAVAPTTFMGSGVLTRAVA